MDSGSIRRLRGGAREVHARRVIARFAASGSCKAAFCREEGICTATLTRWLRAFGPGEGASVGGGFVEVRLDRGAMRGSFELDLAAGRRLRIPADFAVADLERILAVLERAPC